MGALAAALLLKLESAYMPAFLHAFSLYKQIHGETEIPQHDSSGTSGVQLQMLVMKAP